MKLNVAAKWVLMLAVVLTVGLRAYGQDGYERKVVAVTNLYGELFFDGKYRDKDETRRNNFKTEETDLILEEGITLNMDGYFYHPNLAEYVASVTVGFTQQRTTVNDDELKSDGTLLGYNLSALILKEKKISGRVYATKSDRLVDRSFARSIRYDGEMYGFEVYTKDDFPLTLTVEYSDVEETSTQRLDDDQTLAVVFEASDLRHPDWITELTYTFRDTDRSLTAFLPGGGLGATRELPDKMHELNITNTYGLGPGLPGQKIYTLSGFILARTREGNFNEDFFSVSQTLRWQHDETMFSTYTGTFRNEVTDVQSDRFLLGRATVNKQIYASLNIGLEGFISDRDLSSGTQKVISGTTNLNYVKQTPWGIYNHALILTLREQEDKGLIFNQEDVTLVGTNPVQLSQPNISDTSIVVTDLAETETYIRGIDYILTEIGSFTEIARTVGSNIVSGQTVRVRYTAQRPTNARFTRTFLGNRQSFEFKDFPVLLYFDFRKVNEDLKEGFDPGNLDKETRWLLGGDLEIDAFRMIYEHEDREQELSPPYSRDRVDLTYGQRLNRDWMVSSGGHYAFTQYRQAEEFGLGEGEDFLQSYGAYLALTTKIKRSLVVQFEGRYRNSQGRIDEEFARIGVSGTWSYGRTQLYVSGREEFWQQREENGTRLIVDFRLSRNF